MAVIVDIFPYFRKYRITPTEFALNALRALAQKSRLAAFRQLVQAGSTGLSVGELRERLGMPAATLSSHLNQLRSAGLVNEVREAG